MTQTPEAVKAFEKNSRQDQDCQPAVAKTDQPGPDRRPSDDPVADARRHESDTAPSTPVQFRDILDKDRDVKEFMFPDVGQELKKAALRKLFHSPEFNRRDGLDDYDEDFQAFERLGNILTSDMQYHLKRLNGRRNDSGQKGDTPGEPTMGDPKKNDGATDPKPGPVSHYKMAESIPGMAILGHLSHQPALCAHGARGLTGCTRCLAACPANAITTADGAIGMDPARCREKGLCTTVCPTGALKRLMHTGPDLLASLCVSLAASLDPNPAVIFYDEGLSALLQTPPEGTLVFCVDAVEAVGMEIWLAAVAYGASHVLLAGNGMTTAVFDIIQTQISCATDILQGLGLEKERIQLNRADPLHPGKPFNDLILLTPVRPTRPARFEPGDTKRKVIFQSIDYLSGQAQAGQAQGCRRATALAKDAPFGEIIIDPNSCTLCMACVAVCPASALLDGKELPRIRFLEEQCVQCGLCRNACPENAIRLSPRMVFDPAARSSLRILHEAKPFCCEVCGRPFATRAIVDKMVQKLSGHWMYQDDAAKKRLFMCGECRKKNFFETGAGR